MPDTWLSEKGNKEHCEAIVIQFSKTFIEPLFQYPEFNEIEKFLAKSERGLKFTQVSNAGIIQLFTDMIHQKGTEAFISLIRLIQKLTLN